MAVKNHQIQAIKPYKIKISLKLMVIIRRNGEYLIQREKEDKIRTAAEACYYNLSYDLESIAGMNCGNLITWREEYPVKRVVGKINLTDNASKCDEILRNPYFRYFDFSITAGGNSSRGVERKGENKGMYVFYLDGENKQTWNSYRDFEKDFSEKIKDNDEIEYVGDELVDYILLKGTTPAAKQTILIEIGNLPPEPRKAVPIKILRWFFIEPFLFLKDRDIKEIR